LIWNLSPLAIGLEVTRPYVGRLLLLSRLLTWLLLARLLRGLHIRDLPVAVAAPLVEIIPA
jgi:hypothetical protein